MALLVWLPLNGNLNNLGLLLLPSPWSALADNDSGKIGKCRTGYGIYHLSEEFLLNLWSIMLWVKASAWGPNNDILLCKNYNDSTTCLYYLSVINGKSFNIGVNGPSSTTSYSYTFSLDTWYHLAVTFSGTQISMYINGLLVKQVSHTSSLPTGYLNVGIGCRSNNVAGTSATAATATKYYNDVRIYDECISLKQIKEIAKGLVLHYKLDRQGLGLDNILINTDFSTRSTVSAWNTEKNGTLVADSWGGYNSGVPNPTTCYHAHLKEVSGEYVYEFKKTTSENWLGIALSGLQSKLTAGEIYTFSWELYSVEGNNYTGTGLYYYKTGVTSAGFHSVFVYGSPKVLGKWLKFSATFTAPSDCDYSKNISWYIYGHYPSGSAGTFYMRKPKLEKGSIATSWMPAPTDSLYINNGFGTVFIPDCSGYGHDGVITGLILPKSDSPKYEMCTHLSDSASSIKIGNLSTMIPEKIFTFNIWFKKVTGEWSSKSWETILGGPSGFELEGKIYNTQNAYIHPYSWGGGSTTTPNSYSIAYELDKWNMLTMVRTTSNTKFYLNGELKVTGSAGSIPSGNYFIGAWNTATQQNYRGYLSDARLYTTILSDEDILELYNTSALIDNKGNLFGYLFNELRYNIVYDANYGIISKQYIGGLSSYTLANCLCTLTDTGYRIYRPANLTVANDGNTMWGGLVLSNTNNLYNFKDGHSYILEFDVKGQSSNAAGSGWSNNVGWGGGGLTPNPTNIICNNPVDSNFNSSEWKHYFYKWTISDGVYKVCTSSYSGFVEGNTYVSYRGFKFGFIYTSTGTLGTDLYIKNLTLYDITDNTNIDISKTGIINTGNFVEEYNESKFLFNNAINSNQLIEI